MPVDEGPDGLPDSSPNTVVQPWEPRRDVTARFTPGTMLAGRYRIVAPLGKGGMGEVYRADDIRLGQPVALKFLPANLSSDQESLKRLKDEVSIGRQISHPNVCRLYDIAEADGHHFVVMEYVDGEDLASLLRRIGRLPGDKALEIARGLAAGLAAAHDKGVIHRDLKPANVMIDGRGHPRIADFGLAAPAGAGRVAGMAGTIAYMAPEQLLGQGASLRSDVFALGLVLFETFTGRRAFEATSVEMLVALHAEPKPPSLSGSGAEVDPAVERVIHRCLARNPADRPASARVVQDALPGGNPLQAAIALGVTPSPEMVAADSRVGDLHPAAAWACLLAGLAGLAAVTILGGEVRLYRQVALPRSPDVLADRAREVLARFGYQAAAVDSDSAFVADAAFLERAGQQDATSRWDTLRGVRPGPLLFYYRASPQPLVSTSWIPAPPWVTVAPLGVVRPDDPPFTVPGMTRVVLDPHGRLTEFAAVPPAFDADEQTGRNPDWAVALAEAGIETTGLHSSVDRWAVPVDSDRRVAWDGIIQGQPDVPIHIEAASRRGRLVHFKVHGPWSQPPRANVPGTTARAAGTVLIMFIVALWTLAAAWARRNLQLGRGDRYGAQRLALFTFVSLALAQAVLANHTTLPITEFNLLVQIGGQGLLVAALLWLMYIALEPAVRRRWPHSLISWNRLLAGRVRNPLVGRDVLSGMLIGIALVAVLSLDLVSVLLGQVRPSPAEPFMPRTPREVLHVLLMGPTLGVFFSVAFVFLLSLFRSLVGSAWLAGLFLFMVFAIPALAGVGVPAASVKNAMLAVVVVWVAVQFGLLSSAMLIVTFGVLSITPLTLDWSAWYAGRSFAVLAFFAGVLVAAFHTSLAGKPLFGRGLLED